MNRFEARHPDLAAQVAGWYAAHPGCTRECLGEAVRDLGLWPRPEDKDAQWFVWRYLPAVARERIGGVR